MKFSNFTTFSKVGMIIAAICVMKVAGSGSFGSLGTMVLLREGS